ncbi:MAG: hypothetical protein M0009_01490 [Deltaproteobacteria bacterium]|nr:hypothetical protein [Deltaproteobacteria bacterium]
MKRGIMTGLTAIVLLLACQTVPGYAAAARESCLVCHTNDKMMKMLYKPPELSSGEAEG